MHSSKKNKNVALDISLGGESVASSALWMSHGSEALDLLLVRVKVCMYPTKEVDTSNAPYQDGVDEFAQVTGCQHADIGRAWLEQGHPANPVMFLSSIRLFRATLDKAARHHQLNLKGF